VAKANGTVVVWGDNSCGQTNVPATATNVVTVAAGDFHCLALKADGTVMVWGDNSYGQTNVPATATNVVTIAAGTDSCLAVRADGSVIAWGANNWGELNISGSATNVVAVAGAWYHCVAAKADGTVVGWGDNSFAELNIPSFKQTLLAASGAVNTNTIGTYTLTYSYTNSLGAVVSTLRTVVVIAPPVIATQPAHFIGLVGTPAQLTVSATGEATLGYQWYWQNHGAIAGATKATLAWSSLAVSNAGAYYVVVSNAYGLATSRQVVVEPQSWQLNGANPLTNRINATLADPGVTLTTPVVAVAAGGSYSLALKADGTVIGWGFNGNGDTNVPASATNVVAIAAGDYHCLALRVDGTVIGWGNNNFGQTTVPASVTNAVAVAVGADHSLALKADGTVVAWGYNIQGQTNVPAAATNVVAISAGDFHGLALKAGGTVIAWGNNGSGQTSVPAAATNVMAISAGMAHSLALKADGTVIGWGDGYYGQTTCPWFAQPILTSGSTVNTAVAGTYTLTYNYTNSLGTVSSISRTVAVIDPPVIAAQPANFIGLVGAPAQLTVSATGAALLSYQWYWQNHGAIAGATAATLKLSSLAASNAGAYYAVVSNVYGSIASDKALIVPQSWQLNGINPVTNYINTAYTDPGAALTLPIVAVAAGYTHSLALKAEGTVVAWGANDFGQTSVSAAATNVMAIAAGYWHSLALKTDGTVIGWGDNGEGQTSVPAAATNVVAIAAGWFHNLALKADGTVVAWGDNSDHETSVPAAATNVVAVAGGYYYSLALKADGTVVGWGYNGDGETNVPAAVTNVVAIAAGTVHCLALKADGSVIAWGDNAYGEANVPAAATNVVAVKAGYALSLALKADGTIVAWGLGNYGDTIIPAIATNVVAIAAGYDFGLALKADSTIVGWGNNSDGQTTIPSFAQPTLMSGGTVNTAVAGTYTLTYNYTNSLGTVSSISRTVVVPPPLTPPVIANLKLSSGSLSFNLSGAVGQTVVVEVCTNLAAPVWVPMQTNTLDSNPVNFSDPLQPPQQPRRFYRLRSF